MSDKCIHGKPLVRIGDDGKGGIFFGHEDDLQPCEFAGFASVAPVSAPEPDRERLALPEREAYLLAEYVGIPGEAMTRLLGVLRLCSLEIQARALRSFGAAPSGGEGDKEGSAQAHSDGSEQAPAPSPSGAPSAQDIEAAQRLLGRWKSERESIVGYDACDCGDRMAAFVASVLAQKESSNG